MEKWLEECRMLYNNFVAQRKDGWEQREESFTLYKQLNRLPELKRTYPGLKRVYSQVLQNVGIRVDLAYQSFFRRIRHKEKPGYPRFRGFGRYDSFCYPCCRDIKIGDDFITLPKLGKICLVKHRDVDGRLKTVTVKRNHGKWYVYVVTDTVKRVNYGDSDLATGLDVGITSFATLSNGEKVENPRFFETKQKALARAQRKHQKARDNKGNVKKTRRVLSHIHEKIADCRRDFAHKTANGLVKKYGFIAVEDIDINSLLKKRWMNKQILDAAWSSFINILADKAECAGRQLVKVNPAYTSQTCCSCGSRTVVELKDRVFQCQCGHSEDRDVNAAKNILALGLQCVDRTTIPRSPRIYPGE